MLVAEYIHAYRELKHLDGGFVANSMAAFGPGDAKKNIKLAIEGETFEIEEMYPIYMFVAQFQGDTNAQRTFGWAYGTEQMHKKLYEKAYNSVNLGQIQVCEICGYTLEGDALDNCPLCNATKDKFTTFK